MQKFKRKAVSIALSLAMLFSILPASGAFAADENQVQESVPQTEAAAGEQLEIPADIEGGRSTDTGGVRTAVTVSVHRHSILDDTGYAENYGVFPG